MEAFWRGKSVHMKYLLNFLSYWIYDVLSSLPCISYKTLILYASTQSPTHAKTHTNTHTHTHTHTHTYIHVHTYIHTVSHTHTHTLWSCWPKLQHLWKGIKCLSQQCIAFCRWLTMLSQMTYATRDEVHQSCINTTDEKNSPESTQHYEFTRVFNCHWSQWRVMFRHCHSSMHRHADRARHSSSFVGWLMWVYQLTDNKQTGPTSHRGTD